MTKQLNKNPTPEELKELWDATVKWIETYEPLSEESIYQSDRCQLNMHELVSEACDIVGYFPFEDD